MYIIYNSVEKAVSRLNDITDDARAANFIAPDDTYSFIDYHPTEDKAAIKIIVSEPVYVDDLPTIRLDFGIFFTAMEKARVIAELPEDWQTPPESPLIN